MSILKSASTRYLALPIFFTLKIVSGVAFLKYSAIYLPVNELAVFFQFLLLGALFNMISVGGIQNGLVRQISAARTSRQISVAAKSALLIWGSTLILFAIPAIIFRAYISQLLVGNTSAAWAVPWIAAATFLAGPGMILCAILTGKGKVHGSLIAQGFGFLVGTVAAIFCLTRSQPLWAAISFYMGMLTTGPAAWRFFEGSLRLLSKIDLKHCLAETKILVKYSGAFVILALFSSIVFFVLRYVYQSNFSPQLFAFWMVAQRVSDTSTQFLGLYMMQIFVPSHASTDDMNKRKSIVIKSWIVMTMVMSIWFLSMVIAPDFIVHIFLSDKYLPAVGMIIIYMIGDIFRVTVSLAMHTAFAKGRLKYYIGIEVATVTLFSSIMLALVYDGNVEAPVFGYAGAYFISALLILGFFVYSNVNFRRYLFLAK